MPGRYHRPHRLATGCVAPSASRQWRHAARCSLLPQCGARLDVEAEAAEFTCRYCGVASRLHAPPRPPPPRPQQPEPPPEPEVRPSLDELRAQVHKTTRRISLMVFVLLIGSGALFWALRPSEVPLLAAKNMSWTGIGPPLLHDITGDGQADVVGTTRYVTDGDTITLSAFDAATGERLWETASLGNYSDHIADRITVVSVRPSTLRRVRSTLLARRHGLDAPPANRVRSHVDLTRRGARCGRRTPGWRAGRAASQGSGETRVGAKGLRVATVVMIHHPSSGLTRRGFFGFSWTYLFFGFWVPLIRGELGVAALHLLFTVVTGGLWQLVVAFLYNKQYMHRMLERGYVLRDSEPIMASARAALGVAEPQVGEGAHVRA